MPRSSHRTGSRRQTARNSDGERENVEQTGHQRAGDDARKDQLTRGVYAQDFHGIDLFPDPARSEIGL